jgi:hypothetical protein
MIDCALWPLQPQPQPEPLDAALAAGEPDATAEPATPAPPLDAALAPAA